MNTEEMRPYGLIMGKLHAAQILLNELQFEVAALMAQQLNLPQESVKAIVEHINNEKWA